MKHLFEDRLEQVKSNPELMRLVDEAKRILVHQTTQGRLYFTKPKYYLAGGFIRDILLRDIIPKDIDIFITSGTPLRVEVSGYVFRIIPNYGETNFRDTVVELHQDKEKGLDIIQTKCNNVEELLYDFDVSICQCYAELNYDDEGSNVKLDLYVTGDFIQYLTTGTIYEYTYIPTTEDHLNRIYNKFPEARKVQVHQDTELSEIHYIGTI